MLHSVVLGEGADLAGFREAVRGLAAAGVPPDAIVWTTASRPGLLGAATPLAMPPLALPRDVAAWIATIVCHSDPERYGLLYTLIWRVLQGERALLEVRTDPLVHRLERLEKAVRRDLHKMHAFLRFRRIEEAEDERFAAWFEPDHFIVEATASFFVERFRALHWTIVTPKGSLAWDRERLTIGPPGERRDAPASDAFEAGWRGYYESLFNPARVNPALMRAEMPKKYWRNMPETEAIMPLVRSAASRVRTMIEQEARMPVKRNPDKAVAAMAEQEPQTLAELNRIIGGSEPLVPGATQAVLGEGPERAAIAFVGEQPGDQEDIQGRPFVGPAGRLLDRALAEAGISRKDSYLTNAVKHFKFERRGKFRIHQKPTTGEVKHYRWWLTKELDLVRPKLVVALGATAVLALTGKALPITRSRGEADFGGRHGYITVHPSYLLRLPDEASKETGYREFLGDLQRIRAVSEREEDADLLTMIGP